MLTAPFLKRVSLLPERIDRKAFPFSSIPWLDADFSLDFTQPITILAGENGAGKSTLLEAIARQAGFPAFGGTRDHALLDAGAADALAQSMRASWLPKVTRGFFFRAESFFHLADYVDREGSPGAWGGRALQAQSHGESFMAAFRNRLHSRERSFYILDEPEAALSPRRLGQFLRILAGWRNSGRVQALIATHSPIIMGLPGADLRLITPAGIAACHLQDVPHFSQLQAFFSDPESYYDDLLNGPADAFD